MSRDLTVILEDRPGELARLGEITGEADVNIRGLAAFTGEGRGVVHLLVDDIDATRCRRALEKATIGVADDREVLEITLEDRPGAMGEVTRRLAESGVNVDLAYTTTLRTAGHVTLVIATEDLKNAHAALF